MKSREEIKKSKSTVFGIIVFIIIAIFMVVLIATLANEKKNNGEAPEEATKAPVSENTPEISDATEAPTAVSTQASTAAPTEAPTSVPTATQNNSTPAPTQTKNPEQIPSFTPRPSSGHAEIIDPSSIDFSFLNGISTSPFDSADKTNYDWYPGNFKYDEATKTVVPGWGERSKTVLNWLAKYDGVYVQNPNEKAIYLTFDCGYENGVTEKILDTLKAKNAQGIFFVTGDYVEDKTHDTVKIMKRMLAEGNLIGSHTDNHKVMPTVSNTEFVNELNGVYTKLKKVLGDDFSMVYYRPPQGASCPRDMALSYYLGYKSTFWAFAYGDYNPENQPARDTALKKMKEGLRPGAVYLLHAVSETNASVLGEFIDWVRDQGYEIRRIDK